MTYQSFEDFLFDWEDDVTGTPGHILPGSEEMDRIYRIWLNGPKPNRSDASKVAAVTRANNAKKGISQKNLTGSTKQKQWAAEIRGPLIERFSEENQEYFATNSVSAKFWIEKRNWTGSELSTQMDMLRTNCIQADALVGAYRRKHMTENGVVITQEFDNLRTAARKARNAFDAFLSGN